MLFGRTLQLVNPELIEESNQTIILPKKLNNILNHFCARWKKEYLTNLRENQKINTQNPNQPIINVTDTVLISEEKLPRLAWRIGIIQELVIGKDNCIRGATVRVPRTNSVISRPVNKLFPIETIHDCVDVNNVNNKDNERDEVDKEKNEGEQKEQRVRRKTVVLGELKRKFNN